MELPDFIQIPSILIKDKELNQLDWLVYGVIYWYAKLKLQKCILSNNAIAELLGSSKASIGNSLTRLNKGGYVKSVMNSKNHRTELIPLVVYSPTPKPTDEPPLTSELTPPKPTDEHNNIDINKIDNNKNNDINKLISLEDKSSFGNGEINELAKYFLEVMRIPREDCSIKDSRMYWYNLLRASRSGVEGVRWLIDKASKDPFFKNNITSSKDLYYKRVKLIARSRGSIPRIAVQENEGVSVNG